MLRLVHGDTGEDRETIPFPAHRSERRWGRLVGDKAGEEAERALERAQERLDELGEVLSFPFVDEDDGPWAA